MSSAASQRWVVWSVLAAAFFLSFFHRIAPAVIADHLMADFGVGATAVGGLASIYFYVYMATQIPTGVLADTIGPRATVAAGSLVAAAGSLLFAFAPNIPAALVGRFLVGLGVSVAFICALKAQAVWFRPTQFATMAGVLALVGTVGSIAAATPLAAASDAFGWRPAFVVVAVLSVVVAVLTWQLVPNRPPDSGTTVHQPSAGPMRLREAAPLVLRNRQTWLCSAMHFGWFGTYMAFTGLWGVPYLMHVHRFSRVQSANLMIWTAIAYTVGAFLHGALSDRWLRRRKPLLVLSGVVFLALWLLLAAWPGGRPPVAITIAAFVVASAAASANVLAFAIVKESNVPAAAGLAMALGNSGILCAALLQPLIGWILDRGWQGDVIANARIYPSAAYQFAFSTFVVVGVGALFAAVFVRETHCRNISSELSEYQ